ncbi:MAG: nucleoside-diphosphate kinase [Nanoarchaeota archaeon]|nr:nucleoside-diphosphate kinase [Nanoarchaeota archaeon]
MIEQTFVAIKPDGVERALIGKVIERFEQRGLKIVAMKMVWVDRDFSKKHYSAHINKPFYKGLEDFIVSGPVVAMVIEGVNAVEYTRKIVGVTIPSEASPGTIRGDFAHQTMQHADEHGHAVVNIIHASGNKEEAKKEIDLWFDAKEIHSYKTVHEKHTF